MDTVTVIDAVHNIFQTCSTDEAELNRRLGSLMAHNGKEAVVAAMIECMAIAYTRLSFQPARQ